MTPRSLLVVAMLLAPVTLAVPACGGSPTQPGPVVTPPAPDPQPAPPPPQPAPPPRLGRVRILAFGDSMTEGTTSAAVSLWRFALDPGAPRSYPFKLQELIAARYAAQTINVFNGGLAGRRASEDLSRFHDAVSQAQPDVILLMEGANDLNAPLDPGEGINDRIRFTVGSLEEMVKSAVARQIPVLLATLPPQRPDGPKAGAAAFLTRYNDALKGMAAAKGAEIVDVFPQFPLEDIGQDGLHPTEPGYQRLAGIWLEALKARYETAPQGGSASAAGAQQSHAIERPAGLDSPAGAGRR